MTFVEELIHEGEEKDLNVKIARHMLHKGFDKTMIQASMHLSDDQLEKSLD
jgi:SOS response regulatory protein OraA/RecX